jgi:adenylosuccinate lyase
MQEFVQSLGLSADAEARLLALTPGKYTGIADKLVDHLA